MGYKVPDYALLYAHISIGNIEVLTSDLPSSDSNPVFLSSSRSRISINSFCRSLMTQSVALLTITTPLSTVHHVVSSRT